MVRGAPRSTNRPASSCAACKGSPWRTSPGGPRDTRENEREKSSIMMLHGAPRRNRPKQNTWQTKGKKHNFLWGAVALDGAPFCPLVPASLHSPRAAMHAWHSMAYTAVVDVMAGSFRNQPSTDQDAPRGSCRCSMSRRSRESCQIH